MGNQIKMKIAVLGSDGMLGYAVSLYFKRRDWIVVYVTREKYDVLKNSMTILEEILSGHNVDAVINCIGLTKPTIENYSTREAIIINGLFPVNLARYCNKHNIKCFHIATDCVFSGRTGKYTEDDYSDDDDIYGISKTYGDGADCMVLRTSIIGEEKVHKRYLLSWALGSKGKIVRGYTNHIWNGVTTVHLAELICDILLSQNDMYTRGVQHIYSPDMVSKKELLEMINVIYNLDLTIEPFECAVKCDRTLSTNRSQAERVMTTKPLVVQLKEMREFFSAN